MSNKTTLHVDHIPHSRLLPHSYFITHPRSIKSTPQLIRLSHRWILLIQLHILNLLQILYTVQHDEPRALSGLQVPPHIIKACHQTDFLNHLCLTIYPEKQTPILFKEQREYSQLKIRDVIAAQKSTQKNV